MTPCASIAGRLAEPPVAGDARSAGVKGSSSGDAFGLRVLDKTGAVLADIGTTLLGGGNIVAHLK